LTSPSPKNVFDIMLSASVQSGSSGTARPSFCIEPQFCHPPDMQGSPSLCISRTLLKVIRSWNNAFDVFRRISIIAMLITKGRTKAKSRLGGLVSATTRPLYPREITDRRRTGGWWVSGQDWNCTESLASHRDTIPGPSSPERVAIPTELSRPYIYLFTYILTY